MKPKQAQIDELKQEIARLRGQVERLEYEQQEERKLSPLYQENYICSSNPAIIKRYSVDEVLEDYQRWKDSGYVHEGWEE